MREIQKESEVTRQPENNFKDADSGQSEILSIFTNSSI